MTALTPERRERLWRKATCETRYLIGDHTAALVSQADLCDLLTAADEADRLRARVARLEAALDTCRWGCATAEEEAAARYGANWRNKVIDAALAGGES